jgi:hypothetical protein
MELLMDIPGQRSAALLSRTGSPVLDVERRFKVFPQSLDEDLRMKG